MTDSTKGANESGRIVMEPRLAALKLFVEELGVSADVSNMSARKAFQKAVYLGQLTGVDLGYRFGWYLKGPYSTGLAKAYYQLAEAVGSGESHSGSLKPGLRARLAAIRPVLNLPQQVDLPRPDWLELLASWHYLRTVRNLSGDDARSVIQSEKAGLFNYVDRADEALQGASLL